MPSQGGVFLYQLITRVLPLKNRPERLVFFMFRPRVKSVLVSLSIQRSSLWMMRDVRVLVHIVRLWQFLPHWFGTSHICSFSMQSSSVELSTYISTTYILFSTRGDLRNSNTVLAQYWLLKEKFWEVKVRNTQTEKIIGGNQVAKQ